MVCVCICVCICGVYLCVCVCFVVMGRVYPNHLLLHAATSLSRP